MHPLDRPVWNALNSGWSTLAEGDAHALRLEPGHGPFAAPADSRPTALAALADLIPAEGEIWMVGREADIAPANMTLSRSAMLAQMVAPSIRAGDGTEPDWTPLGDEDAAEMLELALLTKPGPFRASTHRLGRFIGVRDGGKLVAMAGERMRMPGFTEVSGVCTHPDWRGRGYAGALMRVVMQAMLDRGETPFLHAYASHDKTIALYRTLGFEMRATLPMLVLTQRD
ncbi:GNAT family N-acetyltransferase [Sphingobium rhizovicinum]|uniref:GNAT family N-acetyltransferase n=1 Tax=Sphingobium rhizovicinum TaxID=432308 RepID=A0ABV7NG83_9SPHN